MLNWCVGMDGHCWWYMGSTSIVLMLRIVHSCWNVSFDFQLRKQRCRIVI